MIRDLRQAGPGEALKADVHVIGAGVVGLMMAVRLAKAGLRVVVTESGAERQDGDTHPLNAVVQLGSTYAAAEHGRFRCLGGTSTRWGGAMSPFLPADMAHAGRDPWPVSHDELTAYQAEVEAIFRLPGGAYDQPALDARADGAPPSHIARLAKWPAFQRRNLAQLFDQTLRGAAGPEIWLNTTTTAFALSDDGRVASSLGQALSGARLSVEAKETVIAAGTIESTRLLLLMDRACGERLFAPHGVLGRYFSDHLSTVVGVIRPSDRRALNRVAGFHFEGGGMRNLRFEPSEAAAVRAAIPPGFAHIAFASPEGGGFDAVRALYRRLQQRRPPTFGSLLRLAAAAPWLVEAAWWRLGEGRLLYPPEAEIQLHMVIEQVPLARNRVTLSSDRADAFGLPLAAIDWSVGAADAENLTRSTDLFLDLWDHSALARLGGVSRLPAGQAEAALAQGGGIYHPCGSARMGTSRANGVVDRDFRVFGAANLSLVSTAAFPSGGGANPTMMLMMAALRSADGIVRRLG